MATMKKRATVYFAPDIHQALKIKAAVTSRSLSDLIDDAVRHELAEDEEDIRAYNDRVEEEAVPYEQVLKDLKADGRI